MIAVKCPTCAKDFRLSPTLAGRVVRCTGCSKTFPVPKANSAAPKPVAASPIKKGPPKPAPKSLPAERDDDDDVDYAEVADDDDEPRRRKKKPKKTPKSRKPSANRMWAFLEKFPLPVRIAICASLISILLACIHPNLYFAPILCGATIIFLSGLMLLAVASEESFMHVIAILFLPFYNVYFVITHWEETRVLVFLQLFGFAVVMSIACISPFHYIMYKTVQAGQQAAKAPGVVRFDPPPKVDPFPKRPESEKPKAAEQPTPAEKPKLPETPKISGDATIDGLLAKFDDWVHAGAAVAALNKIDPKKHRATVLPHLVQLIEGPKDTARVSAVKALGVWGTPKEVPLLIQALDQKRAGMAEAMDSLAQIGDERGVAPIVRHLGNLHIRGTAEKSLQRFGPIAETEVLQYFKTAPPFGRQSAANVLATIGTELSLPVLRPAAKDLFSGGQVTAAIAAIERRISTK